MAIARNVTTQLRQAWSAPDIKLKLKKALMKSLVWSVALYGSESWTLKQTDEKAITAFELWAWRRLIRISWTQRKTDAWLHHTINVSEADGLMNEIKRRKIKKYSHWKRRPNSLVLMTIEGESQGKTKQGRRRTAWVDNIEKWTDGGLEAARDRARRRMPTVLKRTTDC